MHIWIKAMLQCTPFRKAIQIMKSPLFGLILMFQPAARSPPLNTLDYLIRSFDSDIITIDYRVRGFTRDVSGKKCFMEQEMTSIQDFYQ